MRTKAILLDIEGTTSSISFVHDVLFPLSIKKMENFLKNNWEKSIIVNEVSFFKKELKNHEVTPQDIANLLISWIQQNKKETHLKSIQGKIWKEAFENQEIKSHVYEDVPIAFKKWYEANIPIYIFSSGSIEAQKLLFTYTHLGDLTSYIQGYFDTNTGGKKESATYVQIAKEINIQTNHILFISDITDELVAAEEANFQVLLSVRDKTFTNSNHHSYKSIHNFNFELS